MNMHKNEICFYCECRNMLFRKRGYIALLTNDALYLLDFPTRITLEEEPPTDVFDEGVFRGVTKVIKFSRQNTTDYHVQIHYDKQAPDWTPIDEVAKFCVITFRDKNGKKVVLRSRYTDAVAEIRALSNHAFAGA